MTQTSTLPLDSFKARRKLTVGKKTYEYYSLKAAEKNGLDGISRLPFSLKVLLEKPAPPRRRPLGNRCRHQGGIDLAQTPQVDPRNCLSSSPCADAGFYRRYRRWSILPPCARQWKSAAASAKKINPLSPVDLVIDHSVMVDFFGTASAFKSNVAREYQRNLERYEFLRWGAEAFDNFRVVPPGTGICHQVNLEYLSQTVWTKKIRRNGKAVEQAYPDTLVGTDSHTTMVNGLSVLGWGVGGIEAEAAMLGQPISMLLPEVIGV